MTSVGVPKGPLFSVQNKHFYKHFCHTKHCLPATLCTLLRKLKLSVNGLPGADGGGGGGGGRARGNTVRAK